MEIIGAVNKRKDIVSFSLFYIGWFLYFTQGILGLRGVISQGLLVIMLCWSFYYFFKVNRYQKLNPCIKALNFLLLIFLVYGMWNLITSLHVTPQMVDYPKKAAFSMLPIYGYYYFIRKIDISESWMMIIIVGLILFSMGEYYDGIRVYEEDPTKDVDQMINSSTYRFMPIFPLLFLIRSNKWFKYIATLIILLYVIMGTKRGPIVISMLSILFLFLEELKTFSQKSRITHLLFLVIVLFVGYDVIVKLIENDDYFLLRLEQTLEGDSSGRDRIYSRDISFFFNQSNIFYLLFGNGADATIRLLGGYAHNDWIEIVINQGVMGFLIYAYYYFTMISKWRKAQPIHHLYLCFGLMILISFITSMLSMSINNQRISAHFCIGYCLAMVDNYTLKLKIK